MTDAKKIKHVELIDDDKNTKMHYAAAFGRMEELVVEVAANAGQLDVENYMGWTSLMMACRNSQLDIVKFLLEKKADATRRNKFGYGVFIMCIASGNLDLIALMLEHLLSGGVSRQSLQRVLCPISVAVLYNHPKVVTYLIHKSFDVNSRTPTTLCSPLMFAKAMDNKTIFNILLGKKANVALKNRLGMTAEEMEPLKCQRLTKPKLSIPNNEGMFYQHPTPQMPVIVISPQPQLYMIPSSPMIFGGCADNLPRSSNLPTPNFYVSPNLTPFPTMNAQQMFFPSEFNSAYINPAVIQNPTQQYFATSPNFLNQRVSGNFFGSSPQ